MMEQEKRGSKNGRGNDASHCWAKGVGGYGVLAAKKKKSEQKLGKGNEGT